MFALLWVTETWFFLTMDIFFILSLLKAIEAQIGERVILPFPIWYYTEKLNR